MYPRGARQSKKFGGKQCFWGGGTNQKNSAEKMSPKSPGQSKQFSRKNVSEKSQQIKKIAPACSKKCLRKVPANQNNSAEKKRPPKVLANQKNSAEKNVSEKSRPIKKIRSNKCIPKVPANQKNAVEKNVSENVSEEGTIEKKHIQASNVLQYAKFPAYVYYSNQNASADFFGQKKLNKIVVK